jgi:hypothetical protein
VIEIQEGFEIVLERGKDFLLTGLPHCCVRYVKRKPIGHPSINNISQLSLGAIVIITDTF